MNVVVLAMNISNGNCTICCKTLLIMQKGNEFTFNTDYTLIRGNTPCLIVALCEIYMEPPCLGSRRAGKSLNHHVYFDKMYLEVLKM